MRHYYVYILECRDKSFYVGVCNNIDRRVEEHETGYIIGCYTFKRRPLKLVYYEDFYNISEAIEREKQVKKWSRAKKKALIEGDWEELKQLSKCRAKL